MDAKSCRKCQSSMLKWQKFCLSCGIRWRSVPQKKKSGISRLLSGLKEFQRNSSVPHEDMAKYKRAMEVAEFDMEGAVAELEMIYLDLQPKWFSECMRWTPKNGSPAILMDGL